MGSIWTAEGILPHFPPLQGEARTDVLVIGGGMAGLLCAWQLRRAGVDCLVAEERTIAGGITGNTTAKITLHHNLIYRKLLDRFGWEITQGYWEANRQALEEYHRLCRDIPCGFSVQDNYIYSTSHREKLEKELSALSLLGQEAVLAEELPLPFPTCGGIRIPGQAQFHPLQFLASIARELRIYEHTSVRQLEKGGAVTDRGRIHADTVVVATHFPFWNTHGSYFLKLYQQRSYVLALEHAQALSGMYLDEQENGLSFRSHGNALLLGGGGHRTGREGGGWKELETFAAAHYPGAAVTHRWAAQDCMSLDGIPYIGRYSRRTPNLYVAAGFNKWGMTSSMAAARILRDLITTGQSPYQAVFSPSRSTAHPQLAVNAWEAVTNLLSFSRRRCPHMGCSLKWNPQERSWDCPCHGSRFSESGTRLDNPAVSDRKKC